MNEYGNVSFTWVDVAPIASKWTQNEIEDFLSKHEDKIYAVMLDAGWDTIIDLVDKEEE